MSLGSSGETARGSLDYVKRTKPSIVIFENVLGLFEGTMYRHAITCDTLVNLQSNLHELLSELEESGHESSPLTLQSNLQVSQVSGHECM